MWRGRCDDVRTRPRCLGSAGRRCPCSPRSRCPLPSAHQGRVHRVLGRRGGHRPIHGRRPGRPPLLGGFPRPAEAAAGLRVMARAPARPAEHPRGAPRGPGRGHHTRAAPPLPDGPVSAGEPAGRGGGEGPRAWSGAARRHDRRSSPPCPSGRAPETRPPSHGQQQPAHPNAIAAQQRKDFHRRSAFIRFEPVRLDGALDGPNLLSASAIVT